MDSHSNILLDSQYKDSGLEAMNSTSQHDLVEDDFIKLNLSNQNGDLEESLRPSYFIEDLEGMGFAHSVDNLDDYDIYGEKKVSTPEKNNNIKERKNFVPDLNSESLFPSLGGSTGNKTSSGWGAKKVSSQNVTGSMASSNSKASDLTSQTFNLKLIQSPHTTSQLKETIQKVQKRFSVIVNVSSSKLSGITTFIVKGKPDHIIKAEREIRAGVSPKITSNIQVPANVVRFILGPKGRNLAQLQQKTMTTITVPPKEDDDDESAESYLNVSIFGEATGVQEAKKEIESIIRDKAVKAEVKVTDIPTLYYPFLAGPKGSLLKKYSDSVSTVVNIPFVFNALSSSQESNELPIIITGEKESAYRAKQKLTEGYENLKEEITELSITIPKAKHRFLIGPNGSNFKEFFSSSECVFNIPSSSDPSNKVTLIGRDAQVLKAAEILMKKANSAFAASIDVSKLHKINGQYLESLDLYLSQSSVITKFEKEFSVQVEISLTSSNSKINIVGTLNENVQKAKAALESKLASLPPTCFISLKVVNILHDFLKGVDNAKAQKYLQKFKVELIIPNHPSDSSLVVLFSPNADKKSLTEVKTLIEKETNGLDIKSNKLTIPSNIHRYIIGPSGSTLEGLIGKVGESKVHVSFGSKAIPGIKTPVNISFLNNELANDEILISGPSSEVEKVTKDLEKLADEMKNYEKARSYITTLYVPTKHLAHVVGKNFGNINRFKQEFDVKIDVENKSSKDDALLKIQGIQKNADKVKEEILSHIEKLADQTEEKLRIPSQYHQSIIGSQGRYVKRLEEKYGVFIRFPITPKATSDVEEDDKGDKIISKSKLGKDEVSVKGGRKGVAEAKAEILEIVEFEKENNNKISFKVGTKFLAHILGRNGASINEIKDETNTRIDVDKNNEAEPETLITITGTKVGIKEAQKKILKIVSEIEQIITQEIDIPNNFHSSLIGPGRSRLRQLVAKCQGIDPSDPEVNINMVRFPKSKSDTVIVKGNKDLVPKIIASLKEASRRLEEIDTIKVEIDPQHHATLIGRGGAIMKSIMDSYNVEVNFPRRETKGPEASIVTISGKLEDCEKAKRDLLQRIPAQSSIKFPQKYHHLLIGRNNGTLRKLRNDFQVIVDTPSVPKPTFENATDDNQKIARIDDDDLVTNVSIEHIKYIEGDKEIAWVLKGSESNISKAKDYLESQLKQLDNKSYVIRLYADKSTHGLIVGRGGSTINQIRADTKCDIELPPSNNLRSKGEGSLFSNNSAIVIIGQKENCEAAKKAVVNIITTQKVGK